MIETFFLSLFYEGRVNCFAPVTYLDRKRITVLRPLLYVPEAMVTGVKNRLGLPVVKNPCPADGNTKRQYIKELLNHLEKDEPGLRGRLFGAVQRSDIPGWRIE